MPLDFRALHALKGSSLTLDVYAWLACRLYRIEGKGITVRWSLLREQFAQEYTGKDADKNFKRSFLPQLRSSEGPGNDPSASRSQPFRSPDPGREAGWEVFPKPCGKLCVAGKFSTLNRPPWFVKLPPLYLPPRRRVDPLRVGKGWRAG